MAKDTEPFQFDYAQQAALIGHAMVVPALWLRFDALGVTKEWFIDERLRTLYDQISDFRDKNGRPPNPPELVSHVVNNIDGRIREATETKVRSCGEAARVHSIDLLLPRLMGWASVNLSAKCALEIKARYDSGDHSGIEDVVLEAASAVKRLRVSSGTGDHFESSNLRIRGERERRLAAGRGRLQFGIPFYDDALLGIYRHDLILLTGRSGAGKTQGAVIIAGTNARAKKRVRMFALEAAPKEIELRIKYQFQVRKWLESNRDQLARFPTWRHWFRGEEWADTALLPWQDEAEAFFDENYSTLSTYYKEGSRFNTDDLQREILDMKDDTDLVVVDHFHYVEAKESVPENKESNRLITIFRDLSIGLGLPIVVVCHINKEAEAALVPDQHHIMGSSEIYKKGTTILSMAPAHGVAAGGLVTGYPTYQRVPKDRVGGAVREVGVGFFDPRTGGYGPRYGLGHLNMANTKWLPMKPGKHPDWAPSDHIVDGVKTE